MDQALISCPVCNGDITVEPISGNGQCVNCGLAFDSHALKQMISRPAASENPGYNSCHPTQAPVSIGSPSPLQAPNNNGSLQETEHSKRAPILEKWKCSIGFSILGLCSQIILNFAVMTISTAYGGPLTALVLYVVISIVSLYYCIAIYPSFFGANPRVSSLGAIAFFNLLFGGILFGCLWNCALGKGREGISNVVFIVCTFLSWLLLMLLVLANLGS